MSRSGMALKNSFWGIISKFSSLILGFVSRTIFIHYLGTVYLGVSGIYTELLTMLSLAELGFGTALTFAMYKPVAFNDEDRILKLLNFYKKTYRLIALIVGILGAILTIFLPYILKGADSLSILELRVYFILYLSNTIINYFISYKYCYLNAKQMNYIVTNIDVIVHLTTVFLQIIIILITKNFFAYLLTQTLITGFSKICIAIYLNKKFPILAKRAHTELSKEEKKPIFKEVKGVVIHQFSSVAIHSTDNFIISTAKGLGVLSVGLVSNYNLLINSVTGFLTIIFSSFTSGFGNIVASSTTENYRKAFNDLNFLNFWIYGFCSIAFYVLVPPFIKLWLGEGFLIDNISFLLIVLNCYLQGQSIIYNNARIAKGNFNMDKWLSFAQAIINLVVSIIGVRYLGLMGVYIGTIISRLVYFIVKPILTYRFLMEESPVEYFKNVFKYLFAFLFAGAITVLLTNIILANVGIISFLIGCIIVLIVPNTIFLLLFFRCKEFKSMMLRFKPYLNKLKR